jgi:Putative Flp pilus-assembly TadE/G-like
MKPWNLATSRRPGSRQAGQTTTLVVLALGLFLLGAVGLAVDVSNWWFHHQIAQGAADAACTAGVMDLLSNASGQSFGNFPVGSPPASFACSSASSAAVCQYAALNGYNGAGRTTDPSNDVMVSFPSSVPGLNVCSPTNPPPCIPPTTSVANPFIEVVVLDRVQTSFTGLLSGSHTRDVAGSAVCGVLQATAPVPIIVMNPSCPHAFEIDGSSTVKIIGGPTRSVQVNSSDTFCAAATGSSINQCNASGTIDLSQGGPSFSGSEFSVTGLPPPPGPTGFTGSDWTNGASISDPYALVSAPSTVGLATSLTNGALGAGVAAPLGVAHNIDGCPDSKGCNKYLPGIYTNPIVVDHATAIFVPGVYYMTPNPPDIETTPNKPGAGCITTSNGNQNRYALSFLSNSVIRPASNTAPGSDGNNGVMFYLSGSGGTGTYSSVYFKSDSGHPAGGHVVDSFQTANATCPGGTPPPAKLNLPSTVDGNVLVGQCTNKGTYIGSGSTDTSGTIRGLIFFQDRADADDKGQPHMQGGGGLVISGNMYFHNCNPSGTGIGCLKPAGVPGTPPAGGYNAFLSMQGSPGSATYVLGNITTDELVMGGGGTIAMSLNPNAIYNILKASLLQ